MFLLNFVSAFQKFLKKIQQLAKPKQRTNEMNMRIKTDLLKIKALLLIFLRKRESKYQIGSSTKIINTIFRHTKRKQKQLIKIHPRIFYIEAK